MAVYYIDATAGNDSANGTSESTPWKTLAHLNLASYAKFADGDTILFKRGEVWREQFRLDWTRVNDGAHVVLDAYGTGAKPIISGGLNVLAAAWTDQGSNIWRTPTTSYIGEIVLDDTSVLTYRASLAACVAQGNFYSNGTYLYMYSGGDPAAYYAGHTVEATQSTATSYRGPVICNLSGRGVQLAPRNLMFKYWGYNGLAIYDAPDTIIDHCDWKFCGGANPTGSERDGNGLMIFNASSDSIVRYCTFDEIYYMGVSLQSTVAVTMSGVQVYGNNISHAFSSFESWPYHVDSVMSGNSFCHNVSREAGYGLIQTDRGGTVARHVCLYATGGGYGSSNGCVMKNNIFHTTNWKHIYCKDAETLAGWDIDCNTYYPDDGARFRSSDSPADDLTFAQWQAATGQDAHSVVADRQPMRCLRKVA